MWHLNCNQRPLEAQRGSLGLLCWGLSSLLVAQTIHSLWSLLWCTKTMGYSSYPGTDSGAASQAHFWRGSACLTSYVTDSSSITINF